MRLLITAGPTREPIDAVRFISNRSSGRMGIALAGAGVEAGHTVTLLLGPVEHVPSLDPRIDVHRFESSDDLGRLLDAQLVACDALVMAAAVADYRPAEATAGKLPRGAGHTLRLEATPDLVARAASRKRADQVVIAFALEAAADLERRAMEKMARKCVDAIVANPLDTMDAPGINGVWLTAVGERAAPGPLSKPQFAAWLIEQVGRLHAAAS
ncbi:MAG: phosphopantothenoylcysteine decarboxylase [Phycisphaeraceae bacterium]